MCTEEELAVVYETRSRTCVRPEDALEVVRRAATSNSPFACGGIESTLAERDVGRDMIEREAEAVAAGHEAFTRLAATFQERGGSVGAAAAAVAEPRLSWASEEPERLQARLDEAIRQVRKELALLATKRGQISSTSKLPSRWPMPRYQAHRVVVKINVASANLLANGNSRSSRRDRAAPQRARK